MFFFFSTNFSFALNGTVTVLEAPLFATPDETTKIIQHYRKGDIVYIHPQEAFKDDYLEKVEELSVGIKADADEDLLFENKKVYYPDEESSFYKTIARNGKEAYILKEHIFLNYKDTREFDQEVIKHDHTDYRLQEPLIEGYPFLQIDTGHRGLLQFAVGRPNFKAYPYNENLKDTEIDFSKEINYIWSKTQEFDESKRFFFGVMFSLHSSSIEYLLNSQYATQKNTRFSIGPSASYDILRNKKFALNSYLSMQAFLFDQMSIKVQNPNLKINEERTYKSLFSLSSVLGLNAIFPKTFLMYDTVLGTNIRLNLPKTYKTNRAASEDSLWDSPSKSDQYKQPFTAELNIYIGFQSDY